MIRLLSGECEDDFQRAAEHLRNGGLLAVPTETVYGLAADATNEKAVSRIFEVKGRPLIDPLIVHVRDIEHAESLAELSKTARKLAEAFWPGPLTLVLPKKACIPTLITAGLPSVGIRCPAHPVMRKILTQSGLALAAPSANPFGYVSPTSAQHVIDSLGDRLEFVMDGGPCQHGLESTIVDLSTSSPRILRPGPISKNELESASGINFAEHSSSKSDDEAQAAPGMLSKHYSTHTTLSLSTTPHMEAKAQSPKTALLYLNKPPPETLKDCPPARTFWCTESPDLRDAAQALFALMRKLDQQAFQHIIAQVAPEDDIGHAINNRLKRAATA